MREFEVACVSYGALSMERFMSSCYMQALNGKFTEDALRDFTNFETCGSGC